MRVGSSLIEVELDPDLAVPRSDIIEWVNRAAAAVTTYLGRFPVKQLVLAVHAGGREPIGDGVTHGASRIDVRVGSFAQRSEFLGDWILTHEMFHLAFPTLASKHLWMMEGLSDYLEPIARVQAGQWTAPEAWLEFVQGLPQGLPEPGENGLDGATRRERIYWGGNIYWLLADVQIRVKTNNRHGLRDAIRAILNAGGDGGVDWPLQSVLAVGDKATGTTVLEDLYEQLGKNRGDVDLDKLWRQLGIRYLAGAIEFDNSAPWSKYRAAITATP